MINSIPYSPQRLDSTRFFMKHLPKYLENGKNILDVGCGKLYFFDLLCAINFRGKYTGLDIEPKKPRRFQRDIEVTIQKMNALEFSSNKKFDVAVCLWVLEHIQNDTTAVKKIEKAIKKKGLFILAVPSLWSWPFEFGRHGYHYYSMSRLLKIARKSGFKVLEEYSAGGLFGYIFMIGYSWPRYLVLIPALFLYFFLKLLNFKQKSWKDFSNKLVGNIFYFYHKSKRGVLIHNYIVSKIVFLDNKFKIFPASYILILGK